MLLFEPLRRLVDITITLFIFVLCCHSVLVRCHAGARLEEPCEVLRVFETELVCYLADGQAGLDEQLLGALDGLRCARQAIIVIEQRIRERL